MTALHAPDCAALVTTKALAAMLGLSPNTVERMRRDDPAFAKCRIESPGRKPRWSAEAVRAWLAAPKPRKVSKFDRVMAEYGEAS